MYTWPAETDQPIDVRGVIEQVRRAFPVVRWTRLSVAHPGADDDGLWFFWLPDQPGEVQIESSDGLCPFVVESDKHDERATAAAIEEVSDLIASWLQLPGGHSEPYWHPR